MPNSQASRRRLCLLTAAAAMATGAWGAEPVASYPAQPIRMVLTQAPGGSLDTMARLIADRLQASLKQTVIVESKPGASGMLATGAVAKAPGDGYTVLFSLVSLVQNTVLQPNPPYKLSDLTPVSMVATAPVALAINSSLTGSSVDDLMKIAKERGGKISYGTWGIGTTGHIMGEALNAAAGVHMAHIPYKGDTAALTDLVGGQIEAAFGGARFLYVQAKAGKVKLLAVGAEKRLKAFPDVPTFAEAGYPTANLAGWAGLFVPAATPKEVARRLSTEIQRIVALPDVAARIAELGFEPVGNSSEDFQRQVTTDLAKWKAVVKISNITLD